MCNVVLSKQHCLCSSVWIFYDIFLCSNYNFSALETDWSISLKREMFLIKTLGHIYVLHSHFSYICVLICLMADPFGRAVKGVDLQPLECWDRGLESRWRHGWWSLVFYVLYITASATGWSLVERSPVGCVCVSSCARRINIKTRRPMPDFGCSAAGNKVLWW
jgi:hypothetical protein